MRKHLIGMGIVKAVVFLVVLALSTPAGAADKPLTKAELKRLLAKAETKADHERIAQYFDAEAASYEREAEDYAELAQFYKKKETQDPGLSRHPVSMRAFEHCDGLFRSLQRVAEQARNLAAEHRAMAHEAKR